MTNETSIESKRCFGPCGLELPLTSFWKKRSNKDGYSNWCATCDKNKLKSYQVLRKMELAELPADTVKSCKQCGVPKLLSEFTPQVNGALGRATRCKECVRTWEAQDREKRPEVYRTKSQRYVARDPERNRDKSRVYYQSKSTDENRNRRFLKIYGITLAEYDAKLAAQGGVCGLCGSEPKNELDFHLDHDHAEGPKALRDILCRTCNIGLGHFKDSPDLLRKAADYLERHKTL